MVSGDNLDFNQFLQEKEFFEHSTQEAMQVMPQKTKVKNQESSKIGVDDYLVAFSTQPQSVSVGCVDMVDSTKMSAIIPAEKLSGYYQVFLNSMSRIIGRFSGKVIKNVGDCLLYYFPEYDKNKSLKNCLNCGLAMIKAQNVLCRQLKIKGLPHLNYRVSADFGNVILMNTSDSKSIDMIGPPINMCTKIKSLCKK